MHTDEYVVDAKASEIQAKGGGTRGGGWGFKAKTTSKHNTTSRDERQTERSRRK